MLSKHLAGVAQRVRTGPGRCCGREVRREGLSLRKEQSKETQIHGNRVPWPGRPMTRGSPVARGRGSVGMAGMKSGPQVKKHLEGSRRGAWGWGGGRGSTKLSSREL